MGRITTQTLAFSYRNGEDNERGIVASLILSGTVLIKDVVLKTKM